MIRYHVPSVASNLKLQRRCPHCKRRNGRIHSGMTYRKISDPKVETIAQRRMKCPFCKTTWTVRVEGIGHGRQRTDRLICIGVVLYMLGLSYRGVEQFLTIFGWQGSKSSIERDLAWSGQQAKALHMRSMRMGVQVLGVDGTGARMAGQGRAGMLFFVDIGSGKLLFVVRANERDTRQVRRHVQEIVDLVGAEHLRADELSVYDAAAVGVDRTICLAHWLKSKCKRAWELSRQFATEGLLYESETMLQLKRLLHEKWSSAGLPEEIERLVRRFINCRKGTHWKANQLLQHIERTWPYVGRGPGDPTNNMTERVIGLTYKIRAKTMRGFKSWDKALAHPYLSQHLRGDNGTSDLRRII
jgi:transposase-like protein